MNKSCKLAWEVNKEENLYNVVRVKNTPIYNVDEKLIGNYNGYSSIAHNGKCCGSICVKLLNSNDIKWLKGSAYKFKNGWKMVK